MYWGVTPKKELKSSNASSKAGSYSSQGASAKATNQIKSYQPSA